MIFTCEKNDFKYTCKHHRHIFSSIILMLINDYTLNRILYERLEICNLSKSSKIKFVSPCTHTHMLSSISPRGHGIFLIFWHVNAISLISRHILFIFSKCNWLFYFCRTAAAVRAAAVSCLWALLQANLLSSQQASSIIKDLLTQVWLLYEHFLFDVKESLLLVSSVKQ